MAAAGRTESSAADASAVADALRGAPLAGVVAHADGASLAAAGLLARALAETGVAYQVSVARTSADAARRAGSADHPCVAVGFETDSAAASVSGAKTAAVTAYDAAREVGGSPDPVLALAGLVAGGGTPGADDEGRILDAAAAAGVERRPGVGVPTADLADGLAHTTLAHAEYSGNPGAAQAALAELDLPVELDEDAHRRVASMLALDVVGDDAATRLAAEAIERVLRPYAVPEGDFETVAGHADVLCALAREQPGLGVALALGHGDRADALDAWREHAAAAHRAVRSADTSRFSGLLVADLTEVGGEGDAGEAGNASTPPVWTTARLLRSFRSPEPVVLAVGEDDAALAGPDSHDQVARLAQVADDCDAVAAVGGVTACGYAELAAEADQEADTDGLIEAVREVT